MLCCTVQQSNQCSVETWMKNWSHRHTLRLTSILATSVMRPWLFIGGQDCGFRMTKLQSYLYEIWQHSEERDLLAALHPVQKQKSFLTAESNRTSGIKDFSRLCLKKLTINPSEHVFLLYVPGKKRKGFDYSEPMVQKTLQSIWKWLYQTYVLSLRLHNI